MDKLSGKIIEQSPAPKTSSVSGTFDYNYMQCLVIVKRMRSLAYTFSLLAEESKNDILNKSTNIRPRLPISAFWSCHAHASCADCEVCCSCVLKMFVEIHLLSERNYVGDNYVAVSNIINGLMRKLAYQNEIQKKRKEAEENKKKAGEVKYINEKKNEVEETVNWPDDLMELVNNWDNLPENQGGNVSILKSITSSDFEQLTRSVLEPTQQRVHNAQIMRGWSVHRQAMVARPLIGHINSRALINRAVIPRPILTHQINTNGRPLMSHIVASRHHIMSQIVTGRPILSRVISGHSLTGHSVTAQSLMNHPTVSGRHILQSNTNSTQLLQNHNIPRQIHHNLSFFNYNPTLSSRSEHGNN